MLRSALDLALCFTDIPVFMIHVWVTGFWYFLPKLNSEWLISIQFNFICITSITMQIVSRRFQVKWNSVSNQIKTQMTKDNRDNKKIEMIKKNNNLASILKQL